MSRNNIISMTLAAVTAALTIGAAPAAATGNVLSERQIRALIRQEVAKIPRIAGPRGPKGNTGPRGATGPAGMDGIPSLFAHVFLTGIVDDRVQGGITQDNLRRVETPVGDGTLDIKYCFSGLPPVVGGQVTIVDGGSRGLALPRLDLETQDPECPIMVTIVDELGVDPDRLVRTQAEFHILLY